MKTKIIVLFALAFTVVMTMVTGTLSSYTIRGAYSASVVPDLEKMQPIESPQLASAQSSAEAEGPEQGPEGDQAQQPLELDPEQKQLDEMDDAQAQPEEMAPSETDDAQIPAG